MKQALDNASARKSGTGQAEEIKLGPRRYLIPCDSRISKYLPQKEGLFDHQRIRLNTSDSKCQHSLGRKDIYGVAFTTENAMLIRHPTVESRLPDWFC